MVCGIPRYGYPNFIIKSLLLQIQIQKVIILADWIRLWLMSYVVDLVQFWGSLSKLYQRTRVYWVVYGLFSKWFLNELESNSMSDWRQKRMIWWNWPKRIPHQMTWTILSNSVPSAVPQIGSDPGPDRPVESNLDMQWLVVCWHSDWQKLEHPCYVGNKMINGPNKLLCYNVRVV